MSRIQKWVVAALLSVGIAASAPLQNFDTFPADWVVVNESSPLGTQDWFQGNPAVFSAHSGAADSYAASNFLAADVGGSISNWLMSPVLYLADGREFGFWAQANGALPDGLQVYLSLAGASTSTADFTTLLLDIPVVPSGAWTQYSLVLSGIGAPVTGRIAFRHVVADTLVDGDYVGVDTVTYTPEPSSIFLAAGGLLMLGVRRMRGVRARTWLIAGVASAALALYAGSEGKEKKAEAKLAVPPAGTNLNLPFPEPGKGMLAAVDPATGQLRPVEHDEAKALTGGAGVGIASVPVVTTLPNGMKKAAVGEAGMSFATAHIGPDGKLHLNCVHASHAAAGKGSAPEVSNEK